MSHDELALSIVIPVYNEARRFAGTVAVLDEAVATGKLDSSATDLIVVDDGSTDGTGRLAQEALAPTFPHLRVLRLEENTGKGAAVRAGAGAAEAPIVAFMDADMSVDPAQLPNLVAALDFSDIAIGSRSLDESTVNCDNLRRKLMGRTFNLLVNGLTNLDLKDTQCGFKAFRTPVARILFHLSVTDRFAFDVDVLSLARRLGMNILEVPVVWQDVSHSTVKLLSDPLQMAMDVVRMPWRRNPPQLPALVVNPGSREKGPKRARTMANACRSFRKSDPILPLPNDGALILFPLSNATEIWGAAERLGKPASTLSVSQRLISCGELMEMAPLTWFTNSNDVFAVPRHAELSSLPSQRKGVHRDRRGTRSQVWGEAEPIFSYGY